MTPDSLNHALQQLDGGADLATESARLGVEPRSLQQLQLAVQVLELRQRQGARRRTKRVLAAAAAMVLLGSVISLPVFAQATCSQTLPSPLRTFCANTPALASDVNANFQGLVDFLQQKVGTVGTPSITTTGSITATGGITSNAGITGSSLSTSGTVTASNVTAQRMSLSDGVIERGGTVSGTSDLGLYSLVSGNYVRMVTNNGPFVFYSTPGPGNVGTNSHFSIETSGELRSSFGEPSGTAVLPREFCVIIPKNYGCPANWDAKEVKWDTEDDGNADNGKDNYIAWDDGNKGSVRIRFCCRAWP